MLSASPGPAFPPSRTAWYGAGLLTCVFTIAFVHRIGLSLYVEPIKRALALSDTEIGILSGVAFAIPYTAAGLLCGWLTDRVHRVRLLAISALVWSAATAALGFAAGFLQMVAARVLTGAGQAAVQPASASLLADLFGPHERGRAYGLFIAATAFGTAGAYGFGALSVAAGELIGPIVGLPAWRIGLMLLGALGMLAVVATLGLREPVRAERALGRPSTLRELALFCSRNRWVLSTLFVGVTLAFVGPYGQLAFMPALFSRKFGWPPEQLALVYGAIAVLAGAGGSLLGGWLADYGRRRGIASSAWLVCLSGSFLSLAPAALAPLADSGGVALLGFGVAALFANWPSIGALIAIADITPNELRGQITSGHTAMIGLFSAGLGPVVVGMLTDRVFRSEAALDDSLALTFAGCALLSTLFLAAGHRAYRRLLR